MAASGPDVKRKAELPEYESGLPRRRYVNRSGLQKPPATIRGFFYAPDLRYIL